MNKPVNNAVNSLIEQKLQQRLQLLKSVSSIELEIQNLLSLQKLEAHQPLTQDSLKEIVNEHLGDLKVTEHVLFAGVSSSTYYKAMNDVESVKVKTLLSVLNVVGLTLYIGKQPSGPIVSKLMQPAGD
jgi:uncharacterized membrane protein YbjE (DUF340 family)